MRRMPTRVLVGLGLLVALVLAGVVSLRASDRPDGLERVAEDQGFADQAKEHPVDGPLADYELGGRDSAVPGLVGVVLVLVLVSGTTYVLRRRSQD